LSSKAEPEDRLEAQAEDRIGKTARGTAEAKAKGLDPKAARRLIEGASWRFDRKVQPEGWSPTQVGGLVRR